LRFIGVPKRHLLCLARIFHGFFSHEMVRQGRSAELSRSPHHPERSRGKAQKAQRKIRPRFRRFTLITRIFNGGESVIATCAAMPEERREK
jgi:hypothetical protein